MTAVLESGLTARVFQLKLAGAAYALKKARPNCLVQNLDGQTSFLNELQRRAEIDALRQRWGADLPAAIMTGDTEDAELRQTRTDTLRVLYKPLRPAELRQVLAQLWRAEGSEHPTKEPAP